MRFHTQHHSLSQCPPRPSKYLYPHPTPIRTTIVVSPMIPMGTNGSTSFMSATPLGLPPLVRVTAPAFFNMRRMSFFPTTPGELSRLWSQLIGPSSLPPLSGFASHTHPLFSFTTTLLDPSTTAHRPGLNSTSIFQSPPSCMLRPSPPL